MVGKDVEVIFLPEIVDAVRKKMVEALEGKQQDHVELTIQCSGSRYRGRESNRSTKKIVLMASFIPQWNWIKQVMGICVIGQDITKQKEVIRKIEEAKNIETLELAQVVRLTSPFLVKGNQSSFLVIQAEVPILGINVDGNVIEWNPQVAKVIV